MQRHAASAVLQWQRHALAIRVACRQIPGHAPTLATLLLQMSTAPVVLNASNSFEILTQEGTRTLSNILRTELEVHGDAAYGKSLVSGPEPSWFGADVQPTSSRPGSQPSWDLVCSLMRLLMPPPNLAAHVEAHLPTLRCVGVPCLQAAALKCLALRFKHRGRQLHEILFFVPVHCGPDLPPLLLPFASRCASGGFGGSVCFSCLHFIYLWCCGVQQQAAHETPRCPPPSCSNSGSSNVKATRILWSASLLQRLVTGWIALAGDAAAGVQNAMRKALGEMHARSGARWLLGLAQHKLATRTQQCLAAVSLGQGGGPRASTGAVRFVFDVSSAPQPASMLAGSVA